MIPDKFIYSENDSHATYYSGEYVEYLEILLKEAHNKLDEENNSNNIGLNNNLIGSSVYCKF